MSESSFTSPCCPQCGAALPSEATEGLCPRCLLSQAMHSAPVSQPAPAPSVLTPEELAPFFPSYEIQRMLGRGGMGAVYLARQISLNRLVAIKILPATLDDGENHFAERFKIEAQAMAQLSHPGIVSVYDFGQTTNGLLFIVMEYIDGTDVQQMVARQGRLHSAHAMAITAHVCDALAYAHSRGIIHRDIKPPNIMISNEGVVKVADFGLAKMSQSGQSALTQSNVVMGTLHFMAPEALMLGTAVDQRADIYAVGVMLYQMLTGRLPQGLFEMPSMQVSGLDPRYDGIVAKALREDRALRYQNAGELRHDLDAILTQPVVKVEPQAVPTPAAMPPPAQEASPQHTPGQVYHAPQSNAPLPRPKKSSGGLIIAGAVVLIAAIASFLFFGSKSDATTEPTKASKSTPFANSLGMRFVPVPITGGPTGGKIVLFSIWETRVQDYEAFVTETKRPWPQPNYSQSPSHPAVIVSWQNAADFAEWLTLRERSAGKIGAKDTYRLPTDHEWSCAVEIGDQEDASALPVAKSRKLAGFYPWGRTWPPPDNTGNFKSAELRALLESGKYSHIKNPPDYRDGHGTPAPVGSYAANNLGLHDLAGNVWEWCQDWEDTSSKKRILRGGDWEVFSTMLLQSTFRFADSPTALGEFYGFRIVLEVSSSPAAAAPEKSQATDPARRAAEWALSTGGRLKISLDGQPKNIKSVSELPSVPFKVLEVTLDGKVRSLVTDESLSNLAPLTEMISFACAYQNITDEALRHMAGFPLLEELSLFGCTQITGSGLHQLKGLKHLRGIVLHGTSVGDSGLENLKEMTGLVFLNLRGLPLTDAGLNHLTGLSNLEYLDLVGIKSFTDEGLASVGKLSNLTTLMIGFGQGGPFPFTDEGIAHLRSLSKLARFDLCSTQITNAGLESVGRMTKLHSLSLNWTPITDDGLQHLSGLKELSNLALPNTKVTDSGLEHLKAITSLTGVDLKGTQVTDAGVAALQAAMPKLKITR